MRAFARGASQNRLQHVARRRGGRSVRRRAERSRPQTKRRVSQNAPRRRGAFVFVIRRFRLRARPLVPHARLKKYEALSQVRLELHSEPAFEPRHTRRGEREEFFQELFAEALRRGGGGGAHHMRCCRGVRPVRGRSRRRRRGGCFVRRVQRDHQDAPHARVRANRRGVGGVAPDGSRRRRRRLRKRLFRSAAAADAAARAGPGAAAASRPARADVRGEAGPRERRERPLRKHRGRRGPGRRRVAAAGAGARCSIGPAETGNQRLRQSLLVRERHCRAVQARARLARFARVPRRRLHRRRPVALRAALSGGQRPRVTSPIRAFAFPAAVFLRILTASQHRAGGFGKRRDEHTANTRRSPLSLVRT